MASASGTGNNQDQIPEADPAEDQDVPESSQSQKRQGRRNRRWSRGSILSRISRHMILLRRRDRHIPRRRASFSESFSRSPNPGNSFTAGRRRCISMSVNCDNQPSLRLAPPLLPREPQPVHIRFRGAFNSPIDIENLRLKYPITDSPIMARCDGRDIPLPVDSQRSNSGPSPLQSAAEQGHGHACIPNFGARQRIPPSPRPYPTPSIVQREDAQVDHVPGSGIRTPCDENDSSRHVNRDRWPSWTSIKVKLRSMFSRRNSGLENDLHRQENIEPDEHLMDAREFLRSFSNICTDDDDTEECLLYNKNLYYDVEYCIPRKICKVINCCWYWGDIDRFEAHEVLKKEEDGVFLLRRSTHPEFLFTISFKRYNKTLHVRIETGYSNIDDPIPCEAINNPQKFTPTYSRLLDLIDTSEERHDGLCLIPLLLTPLPRKTPHTLKELARAAICNHVDYNNVEELPIPGELKIYIKEFRYKVKKYYDVK